MATHQHFKTIFEFIRLPVITGLAVAGILLLIFPEFRGGYTKSEHLVAESSWDGPVSYAQAVKGGAISCKHIHQDSNKAHYSSIGQTPFLKNFTRNNQKE